jgi:hypothetical protein
LDQIGWPEPFGESGTDSAGIELKIAVGRAERFIQR